MIQLTNTDEKTSERQNMYLQSLVNKTDKHTISSEKCSVYWQMLEDDDFL